MEQKKIKFTHGRLIGNFLIAFSILLILGLIVLSIFTQILDKEFNMMATILGVVTFLFGTFLAFSLSDRHQRIDKLRENDSIEMSQLIAISSCSKIFGDNFKKRILKSIEEYLMATLDYTIWDYSKTEPYFQKIYAIVTSAPIKNERAKNFFSSLVEMVGVLATARINTIGIIEDRLSIFEWIMFLSLSVVLIGSMISINTGSIPSLLVILILSSTVLILLKFLYSLDSLQWKEEMRIFEPYQKTFEALGLIRYYNEDLVSKKRVKNLITPYRIGYLPNPYPDLSGRKIKIIK